MGFHLTFKSSYEPISEGPHLAVCDKIIDLGEQVGSVDFGSKITHQVFIGWQVTDEDEPRAIGQIYNISTDKKSKLRKDLEAWLGKTFEEGSEFDSDELLGRGCQLNIVHKKTKDDKIRATVAGVMGLPKGMKVEPPAELFDFTLDETTWAVLDPHIPEWVQSIIKQGLTYQELSKPKAEEIFKTEQTDDDLPF